MAISEIEKLERRFAENPLGLTFAPLAEAYRKSGDPARALGILQSGLELHPDYVPASIVRGRCQLDLGDDAQAEVAFSHVVGLDPENVIALKALADIAERASRFDDAATRLRQLLEVDRSNDDAQAQLDRVLAARQAFVAEQPETVVDETPLAMQHASAAFVTIDVPDEPVGEAAPRLDVEPEPAASAEIETQPGLESEPESLVVEQSTPDPAPFIADVPVHAEQPDASWPSVLDAEPVHDSVDATEHEPLQPVADDLSVLQIGNSEDLVLEAREQGEFQVASASDDLAADGLTPSAESLASEFQLPDASRELFSFTMPSAPSEFQTPDAASSLLADLNTASTSEPVAEPESEPAPEPVSAAEPPVDVEPVHAPVSEAMPEIPAFNDELESESEAENEVPAGQWVTWSDAALDADAPPYEEEAEPIPAAQPVAASAPAEEPPSAPQQVQAEVETAHVAESEVEPDLVVTESMAELFVRQGHAGDALRIYRELADRRPGDARLVARIAELEVLESSARVPSTPYAARVTGGVSVREMMRSILNARPGNREAVPTPSPAPAATATATPKPVEPTRPAQDSISLSDVFGEEGSASPPAYRAARTPAPDKGVSFDEFFGTPSASEPHATSVRPRGPLPPADDLDQFHAWLQNLKR